jgi:hypothetical protein
MDFKDSCPRDKVTMSALIVGQDFAILFGLLGSLCAQLKTGAGIEVSARRRSTRMSIGNPPLVRTAEG